MQESVRTIYVDLDHTLIRVDLLRERLLLAILRRPLLALESLGWLLRGGRPRLKTEVARRSGIDVANLPFNQELLAFLSEERAAGQSLVLATGAPLAWAKAVAGHLGIFDRVLATDEASGNLKGTRKLAAIRADAGGKPFGYVGDALSDRPILEAAHLPVVVGTGAWLAGRNSTRAVVIPRPTPFVSTWLEPLRPHQWSKNVLVFAPAIAAHRLDSLWPQGVLAFVAFSLVASAFYLLNDFCDIDLDRQHPDKRRRAQASGALCPSHAIEFAAILLTAALTASLRLPLAFGLVLAGYGALNLLYSSVLKHLAVVDLITLALLYVLRVFAGGAAIGVYVSSWLFVFIFFLALSLAHLKRYTELEQRVRRGIGSAARPTYSTAHIPLLMKLGISSGLVSVLVLALYVSSPQTVSLYRRPSLLFVVCLFLFYWIERIWHRARHNQIAADPISFIVSDPMSYLIALATLVLVWVASTY